MRVIIAGSRTITDYDEIDQAVIDAMVILNIGLSLSEIISGTAKGADQLGELWAERHNIPVKRFPADWNKHGKSAGYKRNELMAQNADALILVWDGKSKGSEHMLKIAERHGLKIHQRIVK